MSIEIRVPALGESVTEATVGKWFKQAGESVNADEPLVELETDKVTVEVPAPASGVLGDILVKSGSTVAVGSLLAALRDGAAKTASASAPQSAPSEPKAAPPPQRPQPQTAQPTVSRPSTSAATPPPAPAARKALEEAGFEASEIHGSGKHGQILKEDVVNAIAAAAKPSPPPPPPEPSNAAAPAKAVAVHRHTASALKDVRFPSPANDATREERVKMTRLRQTIARRLKDAQNTAAMLTTFNDVDMTAVMAMRAQYKDAFEKRHGVKLGFMGLFVKACIQALRDVPAVNAEIDGDDLVYKNYYHIGVAVGTDRGLVVPVVKNAHRMTFADLEREILRLAGLARDAKLGIDDLAGGTFTISNGGVYGSLLSTPILNPPQSGILGMHKIEKRPVVVGDQIVIRPMMYVALSYDHRLVDGEQAVTFLVHVKERLEDPSRLVLDV